MRNDQVVDATYVLMGNSLPISNFMLETYADSAIVHQFRPN